MIMLKTQRQLSRPVLDHLPSSGSADGQLRVDADDFPHRWLARVVVGSFPESDAQLILQVVFERSVVGLRCSHSGFEQHASVDGQPSPLKGLDLVGDGDVGVQIRVAGAAVSMLERCRDVGRSPVVHLADPPW